VVAPTDVPPVSDRGRGHVSREMTEELVIHGTAAAPFVVVLFSAGGGHGLFFVDGRRGGGKVVGGLAQLLLFGVWMKHHFNTT
jgi:hypothetical protein